MYSQNESTIINSEESSVPWYCTQDIIRTVVRIVGMGRMSHNYNYAIQNVHVYKVAVKRT